MRTLIPLLLTAFVFWCSFAHAGQGDIYFFSGGVSFKLLDPENVKKYACLTPNSNLTSLPEGRHIDPRMGTLPCEKETCGTHVCPFCDLFTVVCPNCRHIPDRFAYQLDGRKTEDILKAKVRCFSDSCNDALTIGSVPEHIKEKHSDDFVECMCGEWVHCASQDLHKNNFCIKSCPSCGELQMEGDKSSEGFLLHRKACPLKRSPCKTCGSYVRDDQEAVHERSGCLQKQAQKHAESLSKGNNDQKAAATIMVRMAEQNSKLWEQVETGRKETQEQKMLVNNLLERMAAYEDSCLKAANERQELRNHCQNQGTYIQEMTEKLLAIFPPQQSPIPGQPLNDDPSTRLLKALNAFAELQKQAQLIELTRANQALLQEEEQQTTPATPISPPVETPPSTPLKYHQEKDLKRLAQSADIAESQLPVGHIFVTTKLSLPPIVANSDEVSIISKPAQDMLYLRKFSGEEKVSSELCILVKLPNSADEYTDMQTSPEFLINDMPMAITLRRKQHGIMFEVRYKPSQPVQTSKIVSWSGALKKDGTVLNVQTRLHDYLDSYSSDPFSANQPWHIQAVLSSTTWISPKFDLSDASTNDLFTLQHNDGHTYAVFVLGLNTEENILNLAPVDESIFKEEPDPIHEEELTSAPEAKRPRYQEGAQ